MKRSFILFTMLMAMLAPLAMNGQSLDQYTFATNQDQSRWITLSSSATEIIPASQDDRQSVLINIGFAFPFGGVSYSQFWANSNGIFSFSSIPSFAPYNQFDPDYNIYTTNQPKICGISCDISTGNNGYVKYEMTGASPSRVLVCEFNLYGGGWSISKPANTKWQVQLHESGSKVVIIYGGTPSSDIPSSYQAGLSASGSDIMFINTLTHTASHLTSGTSTTYSGWPGDYRYYEFTAPTTPNICLSPDLTVFTGFTKILPVNALNVTGTPTITYTSSDTNVATVSGSGTTATVTGVASGTATITATMTYNGNTYNATCDITVEAPSYCTPASYGPPITNVTFGTGSYIVNNNTVMSYNNSYLDCTNKIGGVWVGIPADVDITYGHPMIYGTFIWVDLNRDYDFDDAGEILYYGMSAGSNNDNGPQKLNASITVPPTTTPGDYRMRIGGADHSFDFYASSDPCYTGIYDYIGQFPAVFQDYTLRVLPVPSCMPPTNLAVTTDGATATLTWDGTAANGFNIEINGTLAASGQTSPYTFSVALSTLYNVAVTADCAANGTSDPVFASFTTPGCVGERTIEYTLTDSFEGGDGWTGSTFSAIIVMDGCGNSVDTLTILDGFTIFSDTLILCGDYYEFIWQSGDYDSECGFTFTENDTILFTEPNSLSDGQVLYTIGTAPAAKPTALTIGTTTTNSVELSWTENGTATAWEICINGDETHPVPANSNPFVLTGLSSDTYYTVKVRAYIDATHQSCWSEVETFTTVVACARPEDLAEANIGTTSVNLSWTGTADSYVLQLKPWTPADKDVLPTATMTPYTFDLSNYSGTGAVAIRHYDVTNMFRLIVDDIVVKDAGGNVVYSQDFETSGGSMPAELSTIDLDGDGYGWAVVDNSASDVNGSYGLSSASCISGVGALWPDNWIILSGIGLGGSITFSARGQDANFAAENFCVYVCPDSGMQQDSVSTTSYLASGLTPNTPYSWEIAGLCGTDQGRFVGSFFKTKDDAIVFTTEGNWDVLSNWKDAEGNAITALPTIDNRVRIDANVTIPANVIAYTKKATLNGGTITIEDGGQLKQDATVDVIMKKVITGYGAGNEEAADNYYFIATPLTTTNIANQQTDWAYVNVLTGTFDLYAFDPTHELEWINYEASSFHSEFTSDSNNSVLVNKKAYLYANESTITLQFEGSTAEKSHNNVVFDELEYDGTSTDQWNGWRLVGNPFSCNAYVNYVDGAGNVLAADFYTLDNDKTYSLMTSSQALPPCTGALISFSATGKVKYSTEAPAADKNISLININLVKDNNTVDQARVRFGEGFNLGKKTFRKNSKIYMPVENNDYAVVYTEKQGEIPVNFKAEENGCYTLSFNTENVEFGYLHLIDNMTGNNVDLLATPSYSFEAKTTDYESRFKLVFATGNTDDTFAFYSNGSFVINNEGKATVQVIDVNGSILCSESINGSTSINVNAAAGVYVIRLINGNDVKVQKMVVR